MDAYDVIVVGAGASGGIVAAVLAEAGRHVLLLERGRAYEPPEIPYDHLRNHRLALYGHNTGPDLEGHPRVFVDVNGRERVVRPFELEYHNNAMAVGGGTRVYGAQAWRFMEQDFRMASLYGVPSGSSLADWPLSYADLEPYYERAEREIGVAGSTGFSEAECARAKPLRRSAYPMPPLADTRSRAVLRRGAQALGWDTRPVPVLINTVPYNGRAACHQCTHCIGFACSGDAKNGSHNTVIPRALKSGRCTLEQNAHAERLDVDGRGHVCGLTYVRAEQETARRVSVRAKAVVLCAGAIESARLLLNSACDAHPRGIGNAHDQVGRHLQGHVYPGAFGVFEEQTYDGIGPGVSVATCQFNHGNKDVIGGAMLADEFVKLPLIFWRQVLPAGMKRWGIEHKEFMRKNYTRTIHVQGPVQEIPNPESRVEIAPVRDRWGIPVARLSGTIHAETLRTAAQMRERAEEWLRASAAKHVWGYTPTLMLSAHQHQAGTCRMGADLHTSVTDVWGRVHDQDRLFVADGSLNVTNGGFNPVLTIMALAFRVAEGVHSRMG